MATDEELFEIDRRAYGMRPADYKNKLEGMAAGRRALYEAGKLAEAQECMDDHNANGCKWTNELRNRVDWLLTDEAAWPLVSLVVEGSDHTVSNRDALWDVKSALKSLHDRITKGDK